MIISMHYDIVVTLFGLFDLQNIGVDRDLLLRMVLKVSLIGLLSNFYAI
jgi:hypothetical protein